MKTLIFLVPTFICLSLFGNEAMSELTDLPLQRTIQYDRQLEGTILLPTNFANDELLKTDVLQTISGQHIHHVDLVYTSFKKSPDFDQTTLNQSRFTELLRLVPQVYADNPTFRLIEQTGATSPEIARTYFHGFVLHFGPNHHDQQLNNLFTSIQPDFTGFELENEKGGTIVTESGSRLTFPAFAVTFEDGSAVSGTYRVSYREFRNQAEIALSGIPMTYASEGNSRELLTSVGMFELRAEQQGKSLKLQNEISLDFICNDEVDDVSFYRLDETDQDWQTIQPVVYSANRANFLVEIDSAYSTYLIPDLQSARSWEGAVVGVTKIRRGGDMPEGPFLGQSNYKEGATAGYKYLDMTLNKQAWSRYKERTEMDPIFKDAFGARVWKGNPKQTVIRDSLVIPFVEALFNKPLSLLEVSNADDVTSYCNKPREVLQSVKLKNDEFQEVKMANTPALVVGLKVSGFGIFNCDAIYRMASPRMLTPDYVIENSGEEIKEKAVSCVVDLYQNGAVSYHPNSIWMDGGSTSVVLLFTMDKRIFLFDQRTQTTDYSNPELRLPMTEITEFIKGPKDLLTYF